MNTRFRLSGPVVAFALGLLSAGLAAAQYPPPPPFVAVESLTATGVDLGVNVVWQPGAGELPAGATLEVADSNGYDVTAVSFKPEWGPQTIWIPGALAPLPSDASDQPLRRNLELLTSPDQEILVTTDLAQYTAGGPVVSQVRTIEKKKKMWCYLHLVSIKCLDTEDSSTDEVYINVNNSKIFGDTDMSSGQEASINRWFCIGSVPGNFSTQVVKIYDYDTIGSDDLLGTLNVMSPNPTGGVISVNFNENGSHYILRYEVRCFRQRRPPC
jgi:hypothetical protein